MLDERRISWDIWRIARCGGLNELNCEERRYVRESLRVMYQNGGEIGGHRCFTNSTLLSLVDFAYREGRITACRGRVATSPHGWCEIDTKPFEISYPLVDSSESEGRRFVLSNLPHNYKATFRYKWTEENFDTILITLFGMTRPYFLSPEGAATLLEKVERKLGLSLGQEHIALFVESARKVHHQIHKLNKRGFSGESADNLVCKAFRAWSLAASLPMFPHGLKMGYTK